MQGMRDLLRSSLARSLRTLAEEDRLAAALPVVCGSALATHCTVESLVKDPNEQRTLELRVDKGEWLPALLAMRDVLQRDLARIAGVPLHGIVFTAARAGRAYPKKVQQDGSASDDTVRSMGPVSPRLPADRKMQKSKGRAKPI